MAAKSSTPYADRVMTLTSSRISDFAPRTGDLTPMEDVAGQELHLLAMESRDTQYGPGYLLTVKHLGTDEEHQVLTSAVVLVEQLGKLELAVARGECSLPLCIRFVKSGRCWVAE